jgi:hypothetical protein
VQFPVSGEGSVGLATRLMHSSGEWLEQSFFIPLAKMDAQAVGIMSITYARRYSFASPLQVSRLKMTMAMPLLLSSLIHHTLRARNLIPSSDSDAQGHTLRDLQSVGSAAVLPVLQALQRADRSN